MDYWFFFSYAHSDDGEYLRRFYTDLREEVRQLIGGPKQIISFLDRNEISHGVRWETSLEEGLKTCRAFVPIYSASYFQAAYCGKEFGAFRERLHNHLQQSGLEIADSLILPVLWSPEENVLPKIPPSISGIQYTDDDLEYGYPAEYKKEGVSQLVMRGASQSGALRDQYVRFVHRLATNIKNATDELPLPKAVSVTPLANVKSVFPSSTTNAASASSEGPRYVQFIFVAGKQPELQQAQRQTLKFYGQKGGSDWQPYLDTYQGTAAELAKEVIRALPDASYEEVTVTDNLRQAVERAAEQDKVVVVVVDTWTLQLEEYYKLINPLDEYQPVNYITLIAWNNEDEEAYEVHKSVLETAVNTAFKNKVVQQQANFLSETIKSYDTFKDELIRKLTQVQAQVVEIAKIKKRSKYVNRFRTANDTFSNPLR